MPDGHETTYTVEMPSHGLDVGDLIVLPHPQKPKIGMPFLEFLEKHSVYFKRISGISENTFVYTGMQV